MPGQSAQQVSVEEGGWKGLLHSTEALFLEDDSIFRNALWIPQCAAEEPGPNLASSLLVTSCRLYPYFISHSG